jgi:hypothetical protein
VLRVARGDECLVNIAPGYILRIALFLRRRRRRGLVLAG